MAEQRYQAVLAVIGEGSTVSEVAGRWDVSRQSVHAWLARYEAGGLDGLVGRAHRPGSCPHQMSPVVEARVLELRRIHRSWGAQRVTFELGRLGVSPLPSKSGVNRALVRAGLIEPGGRRRRAEHWRRWERGAPSELAEHPEHHGGKSAPPSKCASPVIRALPQPRASNHSSRGRNNTDHQIRNCHGGTLTHPPTAETTATSRPADRGEPQNRACIRYR